MEVERKSCLPNKNNLYSIYQLSLKYVWLKNLPAKLKTLKFDHKFILEN